MKVGSQPLPVAARIGRATTSRPEQRQAPPRAPAGAPATDRVEISAEAARAAAAQALGTAAGRTPEQVRELVARANRDAARAAEPVDVDRLRQAIG